MSKTLNPNRKLSAKKAGMLTDKPIPKELKDRVEEKLTIATVKMLWKQPFFGTLALRITKVAADQWCPTMGVDGKYMYYNHAFVDSLTEAELIFVIAHEVLHLVYDHLDRKETRDHQIYNCAADYVVNDELVEAGVGKFPTQKVKDANGRMVDQPVGLHDLKYRGWNSEQVYDDLYQKLQNQPNGGGKGSGGSMALDELVDKMLDEHLNGDEGDEGGGGDGQDEAPTSSGPAKMSEETRKQLRDDLKDQMISIAKSCTAGSLPGGVKRIIDALTQPKMDWRELLQCQLNSLVTCDYSWQRVSRKGWHISAILPGTVKDQQLAITVAIDMSGSIGRKEANEFLSEINGIMRAFENYEITVMSWDTKVYNVQKFDSFSGESITSYISEGGGGTDAACIFEYLERENIQPLKLVILTDGYVSSWGNPTYCDTLWVIGCGSKAVPPFGEYAYIDPIKK